MFFVPALRILTFLSWSLGCFLAGTRYGIFGGDNALGIQLALAYFAVGVVSAVVLGAMAEGLRGLIRHARARALALDAR